MARAFGRIARLDEKVRLGKDQSLAETRHSIAEREIGFTPEPAIYPGVSGREIGSARGRLISQKFTLSLSANACPCPYAGSPN
jgi:hypothetical protein